MSVSVICTGTELLTGRILNTNLQFLARLLDRVGLELDMELAVPDQREAIARAMRQGLEQSRVVVVIGGLGPTGDDITRDVAAHDILHAPLVHSETAAANIHRIYQRLGRKPRERIMVQAQKPRGAEIMPNDQGTAPGLWCPLESGQVLALLPGPPREFKPMAEKILLPRLLATCPITVSRRTFKLFGVAESRAEESIQPILAKFPTVHPSYRAALARVELRLSAPPADTKLLDAASEQVKAVFAGHLVADDADWITILGEQLSRRKWMLATAESCTGGGIARQITETPGASAFFAGGIVSYSNALKRQLLGVPAEILETYGAVSEETALAMVRGLCRRLSVEAGIAVTGIAGPDGGSAEKPVGTVFIATAIPGAEQVTRQLFPAVGRSGIRARTIAVALNQIFLQLNSV